MAEPLRCVSRTGECLVIGCEEEGECYLWRCTHPHEPKPTPSPYDCGGNPTKEWPGE